jgi:hypothetical protein
MKSSFIKLAIIAAVLVNLTVAGFLWIGTESASEHVYLNARVLLDTDSLNIDRFNEKVAASPDEKLGGKEPNGQVRSLDAERLHVYLFGYGRPVVQYGYILQSVAALSLAFLAWPRRSTSATTERAGSQPEP